MIDVSGAGIVIENDGPKVTFSTFWEHEAARVHGLFFLSLNAGALRLLVPDKQTGEIAEMTTAKRGVVVTRGRLQGRDAIEIMFDDGSDSPFAIHIQQEMSDRIWLPEDEGPTKRPFLVYANGPVLAAQMRCRLRTGRTLPDLRPWGA